MNGHSPVRLSVVVPTRDRADFLDECLATICDSVTADDEVIVVDSASRETSTGEVARARGAQLFRCSSPGTSLARNAGWRAARGAWIAFIDDDVRVDPEWAEALYSATIENPDVSFMTGRLRLTHPTERPVAVFDEESPIPITRETFDALGHGANLAVRREALEVVGGFDESLGPGARWEAGEDNELIDRLLAAGFVGRYEPSVSGYHLQWRTRAQLFNLEWRYGLGQGARLALLWKLDKQRCRGVGRRSTWDFGVVEFFTSIRRGWERVAARALIRLTGTAVGFLCVVGTRRRPARRVTTSRRLG